MDSQSEEISLVLFDQNGLSLDVGQTEKICLATLNHKSLLGSGGLAKVYKINIGQSYKALKKVELSRDNWSNEIQQCLNEINFLIQLRNSPYTVKLRGLNKDFYNLLKKIDSNRGFALGKIDFELHTIILVLDYHPHKFVREELKNDSELRWRFIAQSISTVAYINKLGIHHGDIKPANILLDEEKNLKIIDFGSAHTYEQLISSSTADEFTTGYLAPEIMKIYLEDSQFTCLEMGEAQLMKMSSNSREKIKQLEMYKRDVYALGITLLYIFEPDIQVNKKLLEDKHFWERISSLDAKLKILAERMVESDPKKRIDMIELEDYLYYTLEMIPDRLHPVDLENQFGITQCLTESIVQDVRISHQFKTPLFKNELFITSRPSQEYLKIIQLVKLTNRIEKDDKNLESLRQLIQSEKSIEFLERTIRHLTEQSGEDQLMGLLQIYLSE